MKEISHLDGGNVKKNAFTPSLKASAKKSSNISLHPLYATLATLLLYVLMLVVFKKYPLGDDAFLLSDLKVQYAPFLALLRSKIGGLGSIPQDQLLSYISYSFKLGLGKNFIGTFGYYLSSPFNLIYLLIDPSQIDAAVVMIIISKLSLSSGFMCLFLSRRFNDKKSAWPVILGIMYAFSLYSRLFVLNIMWLDGYMLLPLILFFTEKFIEKQDYSGLVISLLVLFISNYYIAYMAGLSCFIYLCVRMFEIKVPLKKAAGICMKYILTAMFTAMITAALLVPVGLDTLGNAEQTISERNNLILTYTPRTLIHMLLLGESRDFDLLAGNYPFIFISLSVTILMFLYFFSAGFKGREKKTHIFCVLGVLLSTAVVQIDTAWQVFDEPNWFWHRQSFVFLPLFLIISYRVLTHIKELARKDILKVMLIMYLLAAVDYSYGLVTGKADIFAYNIVLITAYSAVFAGYSHEKWPDQLRDMPRMLTPFLAGIICFEIAFVGPMMSSAANIFTMRKGSAVEYSDSLKAEREFGEFAKANNAAIGAFRAENISIPDYNVENYADDGSAFYGNYNGIEFFNSNSNKKMHHFMKQLGFATNYNYFSVWHNYSSPAVDSFFSVGSVASRSDLEQYRFEKEDSIGTGLNFYANDNALPLAFAVDKGAFDLDYYKLEKDAYEKDYFALQNEWYQSLFPEGFDEGFYKEIGKEVTGEPMIYNAASFNIYDYATHRFIVSQSSNSGQDIEDDEPGTTSDGSGKVDFLGKDPLGLERTVQNELKKQITDLYRTNEDAPIIVEYNFKAPSDGDIYCSIVTGRIVDAADIYVNGVKVYGFDSGTYYSLIVRLGNFSKGDDVKVTIWSNEKKFSYLNIRFAGFDDELFSQGISKVDKETVKTDTVIDGYAKFSINDLAPDKTVLTTIPAENGWKLYIDGQPAEYKAYQDAFIAFDAPSGYHTAELVFTAPGLKFGACVSCAGIVLLAAFVLIDKNLSKKKAKQS